MRNLSSGKRFIISLSSLISVALFSCTDKSSITDAEQSSLGKMNYESGEFAVVGVENAMDELQDPTLQDSMCFKPDFFNGHHFRHGGRFGRGGPKLPFGPWAFHDSSGNHLRVILKQLELDSTQRAQLRNLMDEHRNCVQEPLRLFKEANAAILDSANTRRHAIMDSVRTGVYTHDQAKDLLKALAESTRQAILNNPDSAAPIAALCECKSTLFENIRAILTETQQAIWDEWLGGLSGVCFGG